MSAIIAMLVAALKAVPALRDILNLFAKEWHEFDKRKREQVADERRDRKRDDWDAAVDGVRDASAKAGQSDPPQATP